MPSERRLHPVSILFALSGSLKAFALPAVLLIVSSLRRSPPAPPDAAKASDVPGWMPFGGDLEGWQVWVLFFLAVSICSAMLRYLTFRLTYESDELVIRSGLLFRNERHVPYDRIQNLDATRSLLHRAFGVAEVRVETGGGHEPEARISVLRESEFEEMRRRVFAGRVAPGSSPAADDAPADERPANGDASAVPHAGHVDAAAAGARTLLHLPVRELLLLGLLDNRGFLLIAAAYGVLWESGLQGVVWERLSAGFSAPGAVSAIWEGLMAGNAPSFALLAIMAGGLLGLVLGVRVLSMAWVSVTLHDFRLTAAGEDLRTEYGLLTRVTTTVPRRRIQSLTVRETPLQRWCGRTSVLVQTAGSTMGAAPGSARPRERLAPMIATTAVQDLVRQILPRANLASLVWHPLHPRAPRRAVKPVLFLHAVSAVALLAVAGVRHWPAALLYLALGAVAVVLITRRQVASMAWAMDDEVIACRRGWLWRSVTLAPLAKVQTVTTTESPFDRRAAMCGISIDTAGGTMTLPQVRIPFLARDTARELAAGLSTHAAQTTFRW